MCVVVVVFSNKKIDPKKIKKEKNKALAVKACYVLSIQKKRKKVIITV